MSWRHLTHYITCEVGWSKFNSFKRRQLNASKLRNPSRLLHPSRSPSTSILKQHTEILWTQFLTYWSQAHPKSNDSYVVHREFRIMFMSGANSNSKISLLSARRIYQRWIKANNLLSNLFFSNSSVQVLANKTFIEESLVFNWHYSYKNYKVFKFTQPFFLFKDAAHGGYIHSAIRLILQDKIDWLLVSDLDSHRNLIQYLQKVSFFLIGLCPVNYSPWSVSYPIPVYSDSKLTQYYFLKWVFFLKSSSESRKFRLLESRISTVQHY